MRFPFLTSFTLIAVAVYVAASRASASASADEDAEFVDEASAKGLAEIRTARLALDKTNSEAVHKFALQMIDNHTNSNKELASVAKRAKVTVPDEAALFEKTKPLLITPHEGDDFDASYIANQVTAHEETIKLFSAYVEKGRNSKLKAFAQQSLPTFNHHLEMAKALQSRHPLPT